MSQRCVTATLMDLSTPSATEPSINVYLPCILSMRAKYIAQFLWCHSLEYHSGFDRRDFLKGFVRFKLGAFYFWFSAKIYSLVIGANSWRLGPLDVERRALWTRICRALIKQSTLVTKPFSKTIRSRNYLLSALFSQGMAALNFFRGQIDLFVFQTSKSPGRMSLNYWNTLADFIWILSWHFKGYWGFHFWENLKKETNQRISC